MKFLEIGNGFYKFIKRHVRGGNVNLDATKCHIAQTKFTFKNNQINF